MILRPSLAAVVLFAAFGASAQERMDEAHGLDTTESPEFLRNAALKLTAPEEKN